MKDSEINQQIDDINKSLHTLSDNVMQIEYTHLDKVYLKNKIMRLNQLTEHILGQMKGK